MSFKITITINEQLFEESPSNVNDEKTLSIIIFEEALFSIIFEIRNDEKASSNRIFEIRNDEEASSSRIFERLTR